MNTLLVAQRPNIGGDGPEIGMRELSAAHGRHRAPVFLRIRHTVGDRAGDGSETAISPQPFAARAVRCEPRALGVRSVAAFAGAAAFLTVVHTLTARDLRLCGAGRDRQRGYGGLGAGIRMNALPRVLVRPRRRVNAGRWSGFDARYRGPAHKSHAPNATMRVV